MFGRVPGLEGFWGPALSTCLYVRRYPKDLVAGVLKTIRGYSITLTEAMICFPQASSVSMYDILALQYNRTAALPPHAAEL